MPRKASTADSQFRLAQNLGAPVRGWYAADKGFEGREAGRRWRDSHGAWVITAPRRNSRHPWPKALRRWLAGIRQIVETAFGKLHHTFGRDRERPHQRDGFQTRPAARAALHNFRIRLNRQLGRPDLAFAGFARLVTLAYFTPSV